MVIFVLIEGGKASIGVLVFLDPGKRPVDFSGVKMEQISVFVVFLHFAIESQQHTSIVDIWRVLEFVSVGNATVLLHFLLDEMLESWLQFLWRFSRLQQCESAENGVPVPAIAETSFVGDSFDEIQSFDVGQ